MPSRASNWVDRQEPLEERLATVLAHFLSRQPSDQLVAEAALTIRGMVDADATEVHIATFLAELERQVDREPSPGRVRRTMAIALWHIAKVGLVRDQYERLVQHLLAGQPAQPGLAEFLEGALASAPI